jgi:hypothetical protein
MKLTTICSFMRLHGKAQFGASPPAAAKRETFQFALKPLEPISCRAGR